MASTGSKPARWWHASVEHSASLSCLAYIILCVFLWFAYCMWDGKHTDVYKVPGWHTWQRPGIQMPLRFAMVHDVIHQRFRQHGAAWYREKLRINLELLNEHKSRGGQQHSVASLHWFDNIAVNYERLQQPLEGLKYLEEKRQVLLKDFGEEPEPFTRFDVSWQAFAEMRYPDNPAALPTDWFAYEAPALSLAWYSYYANKGTLLVHAYMKKAMAGDKRAFEKVEEAASLILKSLCHNPNAHFGREWYQLFALQTLLTYLEHPHSMRTFTIIGEPYLFKKGSMFRPYHRTMHDEQLLDKPSAQQIHRHMHKVHLFAYYHHYTYSDTDTEYAFENLYLAVPFDEPVLGIIGMWVYGGGANPHFALALGNIMENTGQRRIAWSAYRRAISMWQRFWPEQQRAQAMKEHCELRLERLEKEMEPAIVKQLEDAYLYEIQRGLDYQAAQQAYEEQQIAAGKSVYDETFFDAFDAEHGSIASKVGSSDTATLRVSISVIDVFVQYLLFVALLGASIGLVMHRWKRRQIN